MAWTADASSPPPARPFSRALRGVPTGIAGHDGRRDEAGALGHELGADVDAGTVDDPRADDESRGPGTTTEPPGTTLDDGSFEDGLAGWAVGTDLPTDPNTGDPVDAAASEVGTVSLFAVE